MDIMSDMNSVEHKGLVSYEPAKTCTECGASFDSDKSLEAHQRCHHENFTNDWIPQQQLSENNNNNCKPEKQLTDSSEPKKEPLSDQCRSNYAYNMYAEPGHYMESSNENYMMGRYYSTQNDDHMSNNWLQTFQQRYPLYHRPNSVDSSNPRSPLHCDECGTFFEDVNLLAEHTRTSHPTSPHNGPAATCNEYLPQHRYPEQNPQVPLQSPDHAYDYQNKMVKQKPEHQGYPDVRSGYQGSPKDIKPELEEQAELLDLDSLKVQAHRFEEMNRTPSNLSEMHMLHQQQLQQQQQQLQQMALHSANSMLQWSEYPSSMQNMGSIMENPSAVSNQFMRPQQHSALSNAKAPTANQSWKSNDARRPKTHPCTACNKWFTSSGHLKRHYNTTLHKNAVEQSNQPDPALLLISEQHHDGHSADQSSSQSSTMMAGSSGETTGDLFQQPMSTPIMYPSSGIGNESECTQPQQPLASLMQLASVSSPVVSSMTAQHSDSSMPISSPQAAQMAVSQQYPNNFPAQAISSSNQVADCTNNHVITAGSEPQMDQHYDQSGFYLPTGFQNFTQQSQKYYTMNGTYVHQQVNNVGDISSVSAYDPNNHIFEGATPYQYPSSTQDNHRLAVDENVNTEAQPRPIKPKKPRRKFAQKNSHVVTCPNNNSIRMQNGMPKCEECHKFFNKACYLTQHNKSFHAGEKPFKCTVCGKRFIDEPAFQEHMAKHSGDKPYKCNFDVCTKQFNHKTDLRRHMCAHTGHKPYSCDICGKSFIRKDHMVKHHETHKKRNYQNNNNNNNNNSNVSNSNKIAF